MSCAPPDPRRHLPCISCVPCRRGFGVAPASRPRWPKRCGCTWSIVSISTSRPGCRRARPAKRRCGRSVGSPRSRRPAAISDADCGSSSWSAMFAMPPASSAPTLGSRPSRSSRWRSAPAPPPRSSASSMPWCSARFRWPSPIDWSGWPRRIRGGTSRSSRCPTPTIGTGPSGAGAGKGWGRSPTAA